MQPGLERAVAVHQGGLDPIFAGKPWQPVGLGSEVGHRPIFLRPAPMPDRWCGRHPTRCPWS